MQNLGLRRAISTHSHKPTSILTCVFVPSLKTALSGGKRKTKRKRKGGFALK